MRRLIFLMVMLVTALPTAAQGLSDPALQAAIRATEEAVQLNGARPLRWEFEILLPTNDSALSCPLVPGVQLSESKTPIIVSLYYDSDEPYVVHVAQDGSRAQRCDAKFSGMGLPAVNLPTNTATDACTVTPSGPFANVRIRPDTESAQIGSIEGARPALGRNQEWTWYLVAEGWVAGTVVNTSGNCLSNDLSIRSASIAEPLRPADVPAAQATTLPTDFTCPLDFVGYLPPRIQTGTVTAQVEQGGIPNSLRALPTTQSERIGQIQPGRRLDIVHSGPQCSDGYVWWDVEVDGVRGWTAESSAADSTYFLSPTPGNAVASPSGTPNDTVTPIDATNAAVLNELATLPTGSAATGIAFVGNTLVVADDTSITTQLLYSDVALTTLDTLPEGEIFTTLAAYPLAAGDQPNFAGQVFAGTSSGRLVVYDLNTGEPTLSQQLHDSPITTIAFSPDYRFVLTGSGSSDTPSETWTLRLWETADLQQGALNRDGYTRSIRFPYPVRDAAFSADSGHMAVVAASETDAVTALWVYGEGGLGENIYTIIIGDGQSPAFLTAVPAGTTADFLYNREDVVYSFTVAEGREERLISPNDGSRITNAVFSPVDDDLLATSQRDSSVAAAVYPYTGLYVASPPGTPIQAVGSAVSLAFNGDGSVLAVQLDDGSVAIYGTR